VASLILDGATTNIIAQKLALKPSTVSTFKKKIFIKFQVESDVDLFKILKGL
jgi:DNA-binding NarL/FixJ family response regulator